MRVVFNPFTGNLEFVQTGGGGGGTTITEVANYAALPAPATVPNTYYYCLNSQGTAWLPGSLGGTYYPNGLYYSDGIDWHYTETPYQATQATVNAGTVTDQFVSPKTLTDWSGLTLQKAYNNGQTIQPTDVLGPVIIKNARAANTSVIFELRNIAGSTTASITGEGRLTALSELINGTGGDGYLEMVAQSSNPSVPTSGFRLFAGSTGNFNWVQKNGGDTFVRSFSSTISADRTWTLPDITDTIVTLTAAQTLTNKTITNPTLSIRDDLFTITDDGDSTKKLMFQLSGITTGTTRTLTVPNASDTIAVLGLAQTFTAKQTFTASTTEIASLTILDSTYKTALSVPSPNVLQCGSSFTTVSVGGTGNGGVKFHSITSGAYPGEFDGAKSSTVVGDASGIIIANTNATTNNSVGVLFTDTTFGTAIGTVGVICKDRSNHYANFVITTKDSDGALARITIDKDFALFGAGIKVTTKAFFGGTTIPTALIHLAAGTATANTAPLKFTSGTNLTTGETGAMEYNGTNLFFTRTGTNRENVWCGNDAATAPATNSIGVIVDYYGSSATRVLTTPNSWASVVIGGTTYKVPLYS